jgi:hypothetical protein
MEFEQAILAPDGTWYEARACGRATPGGTWEGWVEFVPRDGGKPVRSPRETTQPNRVDTEYWATGLTPVYLEGALKRALTPSVTVPSTPPQRAIFDGPARPTAAAVPVPVSSVLDPFALQEKGEALLRQELSALAAWHLVNVVVEYELSDEGVDALNRMAKPALIDLIVRRVHERSAALPGTPRSGR